MIFGQPRRETGLTSFFWITMKITKELIRLSAEKTERTFLADNIEGLVAKYDRPEDMEIMALTACWLNAWPRETGLKYAQIAYDEFRYAGSPLDYVLDKRRYWTKFQMIYTAITPCHTMHDWWQLMGRLYNIYSNGKMLLDVVNERILENPLGDLRDCALLALCDIFSGIRQMPSSKDYIPNRFVRLMMIMCRPKPIGTGIWSYFLDEKHCYIPLNSELLKFIRDNNIIENATMNWDSAKRLYDYFLEVFPEDPARGYFSLVGLTNNI